MIEVAGANRYITLDLHAGQIQGFFSMPGDVVTAFHLLLDYLNSIKNKMQSPVVVTADLEFAQKKGRNFAAGINAPLAFIEKRRIANDAKAEALTIIGDVSGHDCVLVDEEIDTGGTMAQAVNLLKENGAQNIYIVFVHAVFSRNAAERLASLPVTEFITTDTVPMSAEKKAYYGDRLKIISVASLLGEV